MSLSDIDRAFRARTGLDSGALGSSVFPRAVQARMHQKGIVAPEDYLGLLTSDSAEPDALATELVVPETWFFRGGRPLFDRLAQIIAARAATRDSLTPVRALCVPCSTGEEPYSLAIAVRETGIPPERCHIDAVDLSPRHLAIATRGRFTTSSFRESGPDIRPVWFRPHTDDWEINPDIRAAVQFRRANIIEATFLGQEAPYDLIICRNLFIYLTHEARRHAIAAFERLSAPNGWLCLTAAEADRVPPDRFVPDGQREFALYRRVASGSNVTTAPARVRPARETPRRPTEVATPTVRSTASWQASLDRPQTSPIVPEQPPSSLLGTLESIRLLADLGRLTEAQAECERFLAVKPDSADAHALLGILHLARSNNATAAESFRKTLYLDPDHLEGLAYMIGISEMRGDRAFAGVLRKRLARRQQEGST